MKKYFLCNNACSEKETGATFPQCCDFVKGLSEKKTEDFYRVDKYCYRGKKLPLRYRRLDGLKLSGRAKKTDVLSTFLVSLPLVDEKVVNILKNFNLAEHRLLPAKVTRGDKTYDYAAVCMRDMMRFVNFPLCEFYKRELSEAGRDRSTWRKWEPFQSYEEYRAACNKEYWDYDYVVTKIVMNKDFPAEVDLFTLCSFYNYALISEELRKALEEAKVTGIQYYDDRDVVIEKLE